MTVSRARRRRVLGGSIAKLLMAVCLMTLGATAVAAASQGVHGHHHHSAAHPRIAAARHHARAARRERRDAAHELRACRRRHPYRPARCAAEHRKLLRTRHRLARARARLARLRARLAHSSAVVKARSAPHIAAAGETIKWNKVAKVKKYVFVRKVPGRVPQYSKVAATSLTPPPVAGTTVDYSVRTAVAGSKWAPEVAIHYSSTTTHGNGTGHGKRERHQAEEPTASGSTGTSLEGSATAGTTPTEAPPKTETRSTPEASSSFGPFIKGVDTNLEGWGVNAMPQIASEMSELGVNWEREDLAWSEAEPKKGVFEWSHFDKIVAAAKANGITILPVLSYAPSWASPTDASAYAAFVKAAIERYGPGTSANLKWWELWNEPYFAYAWSGHTPEPEAYARDFAAAAEAAKSVSSSVKLLIAADYQDAPQTGGSTPWETSWISDMFAAVPNLGKLIDGVSVHPYGDNPSLPLAEPGGWLDANGEWAFQRIDTIHQKFLEHGINVPFWITEEGWSTSTVSESEQATFYTNLIPQIVSRPWIRALFPYCLREFLSTPSKESEFGLLKFGTWQPKPAFYALQKGLASIG